MAKTSEPAGCRNAAISVGLLVGLAAVFMITGLSLVQQDAGCSGVCETAALTLLYAGGPFGGLITVFFGGIHLAWTLDITLWVIVGFLIARRAERRGSSALLYAVTVVAISLGYGLVLSRLVEIAV